MPDVRRPIAAVESRAAASRVGGDHFRPATETKAEAIVGAQLMRACGGATVCLGEMVRREERPVWSPCVGLRLGASAAGHHVRSRQFGIFRSDAEHTGLCATSIRV